MEEKIIDESIDPLSREELSNASAGVTYGKPVMIFLGPGEANCIMGSTCISGDAGTTTCNQGTVCQIGDVN